MTKSCGFLALPLSPQITIYMQIYWKYVPSSRTSNVVPASRPVPTKPLDQMFPNRKVAWSQNVNTRLL